MARGTIYNVGQEIYSATEGKPKERVDKIKELLKTQEYEEKDLFIRIKKSESEI